ncbi:MAG: adenylate/guanylate cyclase domain-containing protein [Bacteroidota bacterium]
MTTTILESIKQFLNRYQNFGITENLPDGEARFVQALNGMVLIVTGLLWLQLPFVLELLPDTRYILASFLIWPILWQLVPYLHQRGNYTAARLYYCISSLILITFNAVQLGPETENHLFMVALILSAFIIFPPRNVRWLVLVVVLSTAALVGLEWFYGIYGGLVDFPAEFVTMTRWSSMSAMFLIVLAITIYHYRVVDDAEQKLKLEHQRSERLLLNILPASIAIRLKKNEAPIADRIEDATILFADLVGFTEMAGRMPHERVVEILDQLFTEFDQMCGRYGLEKIKTIGDAYMVAGGIPQAKAGHHDAVASFALEMREYIRNSPITETPGLGIRIGIHCGPVVAGVICETKFAYDVWGDTVNTASRMESNGLPNKIQVSADFHNRTRQAFSYTSRGIQQIKGKGELKTYILEGQ